jgi:hypothetical protein
MKTIKLSTIALAVVVTLLTAGFIPHIYGQNIGWGPATGITGDANLASGVYYDAFLPNTGTPSPLTVDGINFNVDETVSSSSTSDGTITVTANSGALSDYNGSSFPSTASASAAFAAVMNAGGIYQTGGTNTGTISISGLTLGQNYEVQVFNYVSDNDAGFTTLSGTNTVTLGNLPGAGGPNTYGEFASGTFTATNSTETFDWTGAGSTYTVVGAIYVSEVPSDQPPTISVDTTPGSVTTYLNTTTTFTAIFSGTPPITNQWYVSTDNGVTFDEIAGATNNILTLTNTEVVTNVEYYLQAANAYGTNQSTAASLTVAATPPQTITWGAATGISGDNSLLTNGVYVDAFIPNTELGSGLSADGITFNSATSSSSSGGSDGLITFDILSGDNNSYSFSTFPSTSPSSPAFAAIMNAGGTYENGGTGSGIVTLGGLTAGHNYSVQVFNYANDNDQGLTTLSGITPVTLDNLPGAGGTGTDGEFATGTFTASSTNESFYWNGDHSGYTVLGPISVLDITSLSIPILSQDTTPGSVTAYQGSTTTFAAVFIGVQPITNQWQISTDGGASFQNVPGATNDTLIVTNSVLVTNVEYWLVASNANGSSHSTAATLTVVPAPLQSIYWEGAAIITGDQDLITNGVYFDAFIPNPTLDGSSPLVADGITFNVPTGVDTDGTISYVVTSGTDNGYQNNTLFTAGSAAFNAIMNAGGTYEFGGTGSGMVTIGGLTPGQIYSVQVFNYAGDGDTGLTTLSGIVPVTLSTEVDNVVTQGQFATGSFTATGTIETFDWQGDHSAYTVLGAISVQNVTGVVATNTVGLISSAANGQLKFSWPPDHTGWTLQTQSNPLNVGLGNNWVAVPGSTGVSTISIPIATTNGSVFFRLIYP